MSTPTRAHLHRLTAKHPNRRLAHPPRLPIRDFPIRRCFAQRTASRPAHIYARRAVITSAIDPFTLAAAATVSVGIAYFATSHRGSDQAADTGAKRTEEKAIAHQARLREDEEDDMAAQRLPGRPGNLSPDQEAKLKEMWAATLEVFGVIHERLSLETNGASTPASTDDNTTSTEPKKKHRSRLSLGLGRKKDKAAGKENDPDANGNDKHGQNRDFQAALASQTPAQLREAFWSMTKHDHPDALLLRFLRARKWDVHAALVMLVSTMHWRSQEMHVDDDIMLRGEQYALRESVAGNAAEKKEGADFMAQLRMGKSFLHGTDKDGRPCCYVRVRLHKQGEQSEKSLERFTVYTIETARMLLQPPVDTATIVFDMTDFTMANMDYTPVKFMIKCFEANYPESLGSVLVYKSPWLFQGIWKIIKGWLDPVVASKVHFASNVEELSQWIPRNRISRELGGTEDYTYSYVEPREGENAAFADTVSRDKLLEERIQLVSSYETEVLAWIHGEGSGEGRGRLAERLAENYWRVDPFVRARGLYDRTGVIGQGGRLDFYPGKVGVGRGGEDGVD
ncbi:phosphatidylinositol transfer protein csr1 [Friedmanniomyces endolithicus]|nr:phosphatidylinositol transfer protein csr1 [Friedmanniomyces endolithicus]